jgi:hypothetical protein
MLERGEGEVRVICTRCAHARAIDVHGNVDCDLGINGKVKVWCRGFEEVKKK